MLTVLLATRDRARILRDVLDSYCGLVTPAGGWKLLVIDNGSRDDTSEVCARYAARLPLHSVRETRPGKNVALNTGLSLAEGDLFVFTDDDAFPRPDWLCRLRAAADAHGEYDVFGGTVLPRWAAPPAGWLLDWVPPGPTFSLTEQSAQAGPTDAHNVFGPNMAVRASALAGGTRFDESIGPSQQAYAMGSETELVRRLLRAGRKAWFVRDAIVEHLIREAQMTRPWVLERAIRFGRGQFRLALGAGQIPPDVKTWGGIPRYLFRLAVQQAGAMARAAVTFDGAALFRAQWEYNFIRGAMQEARMAVRPQRTN